MLNPTIYETIIQVCWQLSESGIDALNNGSIAEKAGVYEIEINALFPEKKHIMLALLADLKAKTILPRFQPDVPGDELFFDAVMSYYDAAKPHKAALKNISQDFLWNPILALSLTPPLQQLINDLVDQSYSASNRTSSLMGAGAHFIQQLAYQVLLLRIFYIWLEDDTLDASKTMAALDQGIKQITECKAWF